MEKTIVNPPALARPRGFSHGILVTDGHLLFLAGQTGSDAEGQIVAPGDLVAQFEQALRNLQSVVEAAGGKMPLGKVHRSFFGDYYPAEALFEISRFFQDEALVEIEGLAVLDADR